MFILGDAIVTSPSDLKLLSDCEFAFARVLDKRLGRLESVPLDDDPMLKLAGALGDAHEATQLEAYRAQFGADAVVEFERPSPPTLENIRDAATATVEALASGAPIVFQATFFDETDPEFPTIGYADFLVRQADGTYRVQDTKLARSVKVTALLQLAAYHQHLVRLGIPVDDTVELLLGDGTVAAHDVRDIVPVHTVRMERLRHVIEQRRAAAGPAQWGDDDLAIDGRCVHCAEQVALHDDLLQVAGMRLTQRAKLRAAGITTMTQLGATQTRPAGCDVPERTYRALSQQARLQLHAHDGPLPPVDVIAPEAIAALPAPNPGDLFFDFEGDPLWSIQRGERTEWGLDYLFGMVDTSETFTALWAHDLDAERQALRDFIALVSATRAAHPGMHIYHYASYERTHLLSIAARHGEFEHEVDQLLRDNVLVDLYPVVRRMLRVGVPSYSIKKLEPLYMGDELRDDEGVTNAVGSVVQYRYAAELMQLGQTDEAQRELDAIADYNRYDCVSTHRLRDWMLSLAAERGIHPGQGDDVPVQLAPFDENPLADVLVGHARDADERGDALDAEAFRLTAAALDYHRREAKAFWWEHFARLSEPVDEWIDQRGVFHIERIEVTRDWQQARTRWSRELVLHGTWAPGSGSAPDRGDAYLVYDHPTPYTGLGRAPGSRLDVAAQFLEQDGRDTAVRVTEFCPGSQEPWEETPLALTPGPPPRGGSVETAIAGFASRASTGEWPDRAESDLLRVRPPAASGSPLAEMEAPDAAVPAVVSSLLARDRGYFAVQGPPGTGKTYVAANVIRTLVAEHGWRVGVTAQSHKVVEHVLDGVVRAGLDGSLVGKAVQTGKQPGSYADSRFTEIAKDRHASFAADRDASGYVIGGTAWDMTNTKRIAADQLDLLVIDEAGQFSLANTIGVASAAKRVLLLGDPQQLPQVSQGIHPAPVDGAALGHIGAGHDVLPAEFGYFLPQSRRMHPALSAVVSRLSYEGELSSHPTAAARHLDGVEPGLHAVPVHHDGDATSSIDEAHAVLELARELIGLPWTDGERRPLALNDLIVVTPYNAQVELVRDTLDAAGLSDVRVGTVDKFQGQEAVVSIVTLAASSAEDVPRGIEFLLSRNRLNVAISRAQWASYLVHSPRLVDHLPAKPDGFALLSRFIELVR
ncbi:TM0106 family RecB-like putative nuclease [Salinibacterium sp. ZJ77]|uniref:TM0106 family RecB-like putative nuclease n=1 Tax=Salinibacterium sp. ZJ77 TaxID=2708337 RepID=UPI0014214633|nr:TM0106 family RecB-like putative nuclease [Salinibacterium sp. ZJ77]